LVGVPLILIISTCHNAGCINALAARRDRALLRQRDERASGKGPQSRRMRLCKERDVPAGQHCSRPEKAAGRAAVRQRHSHTTKCQWPSCNLCTRESARGHGSIVSKCMQCCSPLPRPQTREKTQRNVRIWARLCRPHGARHPHITFVQAPTTYRAQAS